MKFFLYNNYYFPPNSSFHAVIKQTPCFFRSSLNYFFKIYVSQMRNNGDYLLLWLLLITKKVFTTLEGGRTSPIFINCLEEIPLYGTRVTFRQWNRYQLISRHKKNESSPTLMNQVFRYIEIQLTSEAEMTHTKDTGEQFDHFVF